MRVLNPNYLWTCDPYTADHNYMLSKTFKMCDPVVDDGKLDALFCGIICASPPGSPLSKASEISGNSNQDIFWTRDIDLKCVLDDCNPAAKALAEVQGTSLEYNQSGVDASRVDASEISPLPVNEQDTCLPAVVQLVEVLSTDPKVVHETTDDSSCSGSPLLPSSAINVPLPVPMKTMKPRVAPPPISAEKRMTVAQASRPAVTSTAKRKEPLTTTASTPSPGLSLPACTLDNADILSSEPRAAAPVRLGQHSTPLEAPYWLETKGQLSSSFVSTTDDKNNKWEPALQSGFNSSLSNGLMKNQSRAESSQTPTVDPVPVVHSERLTSRTPVTVIQFLTKNKGKRKRSSSEVIEPTEKKRRVQNKGTKTSPAVVDGVQPSSSTASSSNGKNLPAQKQKRARKSTKEKPEVIDVNPEPRPLHASSSTVIPQPDGLRQLLPASMRPVPRISSVPPPSPSDGFAMPPTNTSSPSSVTQSPALGSQATALPFNTVLPNNLGYGIPCGGYTGMPPGTFDQVSSYSAQYLERQRALLLRQQMQAQRLRGMNQTVGTSFVDPRFASNGAAMPSTLAPAATPTMNNGIWNHNGYGGGGPSRAFFQNSSLHSQMMEPFDTFGVTWTPPVQPVQANTTHPKNWYP